MPEHSPAISQRSEQVANVLLVGRRFGADGREQTIFSSDRVSVVWLLLHVSSSLNRRISPTTHCTFMITNFLQLATKSRTSSWQFDWIGRESNPMGKSSTFSTCDLSVAEERSSVTGLYTSRSCSVCMSNMRPIQRTLRSILRYCERVGEDPVLRALPTELPTRGRTGLEPATG